MNHIAEVLYQFWSSFGVSAYVEGYAPEDAGTKYITYSLVQPDWRTQGTHYARIWHRSPSYTEITQLAESISARIGEGISIPCGDGFICIFKDDYFIQFQPTDERDWKVAYLSLIIETNISL